jgi:hypothetical protein
VKTGKRPAPLSPPDSPSWDADIERYEMRWFSIEEVAALCRRSPSTIAGLISKHQLRRKLAWRTIGRRRQRLTLLAPNTAKWLQRITLFRETKYLEYPPR